MKSNSEIKDACRAKAEAKHQKIVKFVDALFRKYSSVIEKELIMDRRAYLYFDPTNYLSEGRSNLDQFLIGMEFRRRLRDLGYDVHGPVKGCMRVRLH